MTSFLVLEHAGARLQIAPATGGSVVAFEWRGTHVLRPTAPAMAEAGDVRRHACYPLVPYSNRIAEGRLTFRGVTHRLDLNFGDHPHSIHGVGWQRPWTVEAHDDTSALLSYRHAPRGSADDPDTRAWPWPFRATQHFALSGDGEHVALRTRLAIENAGAEAFPFGLGWHPFFPREAGTVLGFVAERVWESSATVLPLRLVAVTGDYGFDPPRPIGATTLDNVYTGWRGEATVAVPAERRMTVLRGDSACPFFVCYIPPGQPYIAIEPVTQMTDAFNRAERGLQDTGTRILEPGQAFAASMEIVARQS